MSRRPVDALPRADIAAFLDRLGSRTPAMFLDYDGTLSPIVPDPADAVLDDEDRAVIARLAARCPTAIVSGRDHDDVRALVALDEVLYAGSHGFDISGPGGLRHQHEGGLAALPALDAAEEQLDRALAGVAGATVERKRFAVATHYRAVAPEQVERVEAAVREAARVHDGLRVTGGKKIFELRPDFPWDKGRAVLWLLETLGLDRPEDVPVYLGDDLTDEDAFAALDERGIGIVVEGEHEGPTAADFRLPSPAAALRFLDALAARLAER